MTTEIKVPWYKDRHFQIPTALICVLILFSSFVMIINHRFPVFFTLTPGSQTVGADTGAPGNELTEGAVKKGLMTTDTMLVISDDLFSNWLPNDKIWPTVLLDNPQNFQLGQLEMIRYTTRVMRDKLTRLRTTDRIDPDCDATFTLLSNDPFKWVLPSAENRFQGGTESLRRYRDRLAAGQAEFYPRADNLNELLDQYVSLFGGINTRLANAPNRQRFKMSEEGAGEKDINQPERLVDTKVPWTTIDDNFYYAQGAAYVLRQMMVAIKYDFAEILRVKNAAAQIDSIIEVLNQAQFEPLIVLNGDTGGLLANHSMQLHSLLENARQKIRNLNDMISQ